MERVEKREVDVEGELVLSTPSLNICAPRPLLRNMIISLHLPYSGLFFSDPGLLATCSLARPLWLGGSWLSPFSAHP
jgi:hypothetical protein